MKKYIALCLIVGSVLYIYKVNLTSKKNRNSMAPAKIKKSITQTNTFEAATNKRDVASVASVSKGAKVNSADPREVLRKSIADKYQAYESISLNNKIYYQSKYGFMLTHEFDQLSKEEKEGFDIIEKLEGYSILKPKSRSTTLPLLLIDPLTESPVYPSGTIFVSHNGDYENVRKQIQSSDIDAKDISDYDLIQKAVVKVPSHMALKSAVMLEEKGIVKGEVEMEVSTGLLKTY